MIDRRLPDELLEQYLVDADRMVAHGIASAADIDVAMRLGAGFPSGPFESRGEDVVAASADSKQQPVWTHAAVLGTGHMASGIAEAVARAGREVGIIGRSITSVDQSRAAVLANLDRSVSRERITAEEAAAILGRIEFLVGYDGMPDVDVVIEAVAEDLPLKRRMLAEADALLPQQVVLATNTSSYRVAEVMRDVQPSRTTYALHFFNPAAVMKLVEIVPGPGAADEDRTADAWVRQLSKIPVRSADTRGFIVNRLLIPYLNDAVRLHERGVPLEEIDEAMTTHAGLPMGPFALLDLIGLDVTVAALESMAAAEDTPRLRPTQRLLELVHAGRLGRKTGAGFYQEGH